MIFAFQNLTKRAFTDELDQLKAIAYLVTRHDAIVTVIVVEPIVDEALKFGWLILLVLLGKVVDFIEFDHLVLFVH